VQHEINLRRLGVIGLERRAAIHRRLGPHRGELLADLANRDFDARERVEDLWHEGRDAQGCLQV
jgi:hypothetical protein